MSQTLQAIFNNNEALLGKEKYMVLPREINRLFIKLESAGIFSLKRSMLLQELLSHKTDDRNVYPSHDTLSENLEVSVTAIKNGIADIVESGLMKVVKGLYGLDKRKNTYDLTPFLDLLACFVEDVRAGKAVCIKTLLNDVLSGNRTPRKAKENKPKVELPEAIKLTIEGVSDSRKTVYNKYVLKYLNTLDEETIIYTINKIETYFQEGVGNFEGYVSKVFKSASNGDKQRDEAKTLENENKRKQAPSRKSVREEKKPEWFDGHKAKQEKINNESSEERETRLREIASKDEMEEIANEFTQKLFAEQHGYENFEDMESTADYLGFVLSFMDKVEGKGSLKVEIYNLYHDEKLVLKAN